MFHSGPLSCCSRALAGRSPLTNTIPVHRPADDEPRRARGAHATRAVESSSKYRSSVARDIQGFSGASDYASPTNTCRHTDAAVRGCGDLRVAQYGRRFFGELGGLRGEQGDPAELPPAKWPDGNFTACHMLYTSVRREPSGAGWRTDYPWGERHLLMRLAELTKTRVSRVEGNTPHSWLVRLTDDALFGCPYLMASDVGTIGLTTAEAARLRLYLEKGGFLWVDDFWGDAAWEQWSSEFAKAMPPPITSSRTCLSTIRSSTRCSR